MQYKRYLFTFARDESILKLRGNAFPLAVRLRLLKFLTLLPDDRAPLSLSKGVASFGLLQQGYDPSAQYTSQAGSPLRTRGYELIRSVPQASVDMVFVWVAIRDALEERVEKCVSYRDPALL
jgi:hypothetical protein